MNEWYLIPVKVEEFKVSKCDGVYNSTIPCLKDRFEGLTMRTHDETKIVTFLDGIKEFYADSVLSEVGIKVVPNADGEIVVTFKVPKD